MCADEIWIVLYRLAPDLGIRSALLPRLPVWQKPRGSCRKACSSKFACALLGGYGNLANRQGSASGKSRVGDPGPPRAQRFPKGTVFHQSCYEESLTFSRRRPEVRACADRPAAAFFSFGPSTARFLFVKNKKKMGGGFLR